MLAECPRRLRRCPQAAAADRDEPCWQHPHGQARARHRRAAQARKGPKKQRSSRGPPTRHNRVARSKEEEETAESTGGNAGQNEPPGLPSARTVAVARPTRKPLVWAEKA